MKILVADDSDMMRHLLVASLKKWNYDIVVATDGAEAWQLFQQEPTPLVLTDWTMPEMDGLELIRRIRGLHLPSYVYIILLTGHTEKDDLVTGMEAGADDYLPKPIDPRELRARIRQGERIVHLEKHLADQNRELRDTQAALVESEKMAGLGQLAAGMAHEINNPVAFVTNNLAVFKRDVAALIDLLEKYRQGRDVLAAALPELAAEAARLEDKCDLDWLYGNLPQLILKSQDGLARVRQIVLNLRDFVRLDEAEVGELDVNAGLELTATVLKHELDARQLSLTMHFSPLRPIHCRPSKINQVFYSLLLNAIQASPPGVSIELCTREAATGIIIEIADHGCGIDPAHAPRVFEPFFTTKPVGSGRGLGLAICYGIVRDHDGTIQFESVPDSGTTFRVQLPWLPPGAVTSAAS